MKIDQILAEGADERGQKRLWAQITDYEKRAKATSNDIKKQHLLKMADELRGKLKTSDLNEFAPPGGDDREPNEEEILRQLAAQWWSGSEQQMARAQQALEAMGWEIGPDESGDDDAGVYVYRIGDDDGRDTIAFGHSDLSLDEAKKKKKSSRSLRGYFFPGYAYYGSGESGEGGGDGGGESINRGVAEMDSQGYTGSRDRKKTSKYGSRDHYDLGGPESTGRPLTAKQMMDKAHKEMMKSMSNAEKVDKGWRNPNIDEGAGNIGNAIKSLYQKIYNAGDDEIEYFYNDSPIFAQYWDEYEGDLDSIIAEVDPGELQVILDELESYVQNANLAEGSEEVDTHGRTKAEWVKAVHAKYPMARVIHNKDNTQVMAVLPNGKEIRWIKDEGIIEQGVAEAGFTKTPSGDYINQHTGVRSSKPPVKKKRGEKTGAEWDAIEKAKKDKEQGVAEDTIHVGYRNSSGDWIKTTTHDNYRDAKAAMERLVKAGKKGVQHRYDNKGNIDPGAMMTARPDSGVAEGDKKPEPPEADYGPDYQDMVARVKKLAGLGPLKTVYDPQKRVYKNVPTAVQPKK